MDDNGHVGIGTTSPSHALHVYGADNLLAEFQSSDSISEIRIKDNTKYTRLLTVGGLFKVMPNDGVETLVVDGTNDKVFIGGGSTSDSLLELREYSTGRGQICFYPPGGTSKNRIYATTEASPNMVVHADASIELDADEETDSQS